MNESYKFKLSLAGVIFFTTFLLANLRGTVFFPIHPATTLNPFGSAWIVMIIWIILLLLAFFDLMRDKKIASFLGLWSVHKILLLFILYVGFSSFWSVSFDLTLFRWFELLCTTILASYFVLQYKSLRFFEILLWIFSGLVITNIIICIFMPTMGISSGYPYYGAWNGIFWHKKQIENVSKRH